VSDEVQPGTKIDADVWQAFRDEVRERHGVVRGHLKTELENALRAYADGPQTADADVERRLARIEAAVGVGATDGGAHPPEPSPDTDTPNGVPDEKPHPNSGTKKKIAWLAAEYRRQYGDDNLTLEKALPHLVKKVIDQEYGFADEERTDEYVSDVLDELDLVPHPEYDHKYIPPERRDEIVQQDEPAETEADE